MFNLFTKARIYMAAAAIGFLGIMAAFWSGRRSGAKIERMEAQIDEYNEFVATTERINSVEPSTDVNDARKFLHERGK